MAAPLKLLTPAPTTLLRAALVALLASTLGACSWFQFPGVYRINIQQGNIITQDMVDQLEPGMTKRQVNFVLGTALIQDSFNLNRWDYYYGLIDAQGKHTNRHFTVYFEDDKLLRTEGDYLREGAPNPDRESDQLEKLKDIEETFSSNQRDKSDTGGRSASL